MQAKTYFSFANIKKLERTQEKATLLITNYMIFYLGIQEYNSKVMIIKGNQ
jgi:hypothetical protein